MEYGKRFLCQPNRNVADKQIMADWVRAHDGENIIKTKAEVNGSQIENLRTASIPYTEINDIKDKVLKSFLKNKIVANDSTKRIQVKDIPACIHF